MRRAAKIDANQTDIVKALLKSGCTVVSLAAVGKGCPDLLVGKLGNNVLIEIKDGRKPPSARTLTDQQVIFRANWEGQYAVVETIEQALEVMKVAVA